MLRSKSEDQLAHSIRETARKIGVSGYTIWHAIKKGELHASDSEDV